TDFDKVVSSSPDIVREALRQLDASARAYALQALVVLRIPVEPYIAEISAMAVSGSKEVREKAELIVKDNIGLFQPLLEKFAETGSSDERYNAVKALGRLGQESVRSFLSQRLEAEKSAKVAEAIRECTQTSESKPSNDETTEGEEFELPPVPPVSVR